MSNSQYPSCLCCPECKSEALSFTQDLEQHPAPHDSRCGLRCDDCGREYPYTDGVWCMWSDTVKELHLDPASQTLEEHVAVKKANIQIYRDAATHYTEQTANGHVGNVRRLRAHAESFIETTSNRPKVAVDVGCATGIGFEDAVGKYDEVVGVDISLENLRQLPDEGVFKVLADAEQLPFRANSVDLVTCFAAMHHFPNPSVFLKNSFACLASGGVCVTGGDPSRAALKMGPLAAFVFHLRRPIYRFLSRWSSAFYLHKNSELQEQNDTAECQRTRGGFDPQQLEAMLETVGFEFRKVFYGTASTKTFRYGIPPWKTFVLKALSFQNPLRVENFANVATLGKKRSADGENAPIEASRRAA